MARIIVVLNFVISGMPMSQMTEMHVAPCAPPMSHNSSSQQIWLTDLGATNHMTTDLQNLSMSTPYPTSEIIQTANGAGLPISHIGSSVLHTLIQPLKLNSVLYV